MNKVLQQLEKFHGHLGPYAIIGYKMGEIANKRIGTDPFSKKAIVWTGRKPPLSCIIDGIQMSSGCTFGKGNILVHDTGVPKAVFTNKNGEKVAIILKSSIKKEIDTTVTEDNIIDFSKQFHQRSDEELFTII